MSVIAQISVGDVMYYQVDDIPTHTAPKGSVALMSSSNNWDNGFTYVNNDGGTTWLKCISPSYGKISLTNATNSIDFDSQSTASFFAYNGTPAGATWTFENGSNDWILATENTTLDDLKYTGSTTMRGFVELSTTVRGGTAKWVSHNITVAENFSVITTSVNQYFTGDNGATANCGWQSIREITTNDYFTVGINPVSREAGGGASTRSYIPKHAQLSVIKIDEPLVFTQTATTIDEGFESSGFTENSWTVANDSENIWVVGQAENNGGTSSAYVSNNGGTSATYNINNSEVSHFYKDFTFPSSATSVTLTFDWKCQGENAAGANQYDYGAVVIAPTTTTPVAGTEVTTTQSAGAATTRIGATTNLGKFNLGYGTSPGTTWNSETIDLSDYIGETKRLIFTWNNDGSVGTSPPFIVDNIKITIDSGASTY